jgi:hypothetical protein
MYDGSSKRFRINRLKKMCVKENQIHKRILDQEFHQFCFPTICAFVSIANNNRFFGFEILISNYSEKIANS